MKPLVNKTETVLHSAAQPVVFPNQELSALLHDMWETMRANGGIGLAAPQIGVSLAVAVIQVPHRDKLELINPELLAKKGKQVWAIEGCLSLPGEEHKVLRAMQIVVRYQDRSKKFHIETLHGLEAQCFQHEFDHLQGKLI